MNPLSIRKTEMQSKLQFDKSTRLPTPIVIVNMGVSGQAALSLLLTLGYAREDVFEYSEALQIAPATLVVSPGYPLSTPWIQELKKSVIITNEFALAFSFLENEKVVGVTGSVGKSTLVALLEAGLKAASMNFFVGGNYGTPLATYVDQVLNQKRERADWIVVELSSYQLENFANLKLDACVVTSLTPNHLERYASVDEYYQTKLSILDKTKGPRILNLSGAELKKVAAQRTDVLWVDRNSESVQSSLKKGAALLGEHNQDNIALALTMAKEMQWPTKCEDAFLAFSGLPHRLQNLGTKNGVTFVNDSKATTMASVLQAVQSLQSEIDRSEKTWWLLGGKDKAHDWSELSVLADHEKIEFIFFGACGVDAKAQSGLLGEVFASLHTAVDFIVENSSAQNLVVLSPGGTSWDEFKSFEDRGEHFSKWVGF
jgi:UDP-N-acetylmuramoylalanine--D-glutamate ligase